MENLSFFLDINWVKLTGSTPSLPTAFKRTLFAVGWGCRKHRNECSFISIIHPRCIKEVFSDATVFIADFGLFLHHIGSDSKPRHDSGRVKPPPWSLVPLPKQRKIQIRPDFGRSYRHLSFSKQPIKTAFHTPLLYNTIFTSSGFGCLLPESVPR